MTVRPDGFSLIEVLVALLVLELLLVGAATSMRIGAARAADARVREQAVWDAGALADSIGARLAAPHATRATPWGWIEADAARVQAFDSAGRPLVVVEVVP